MIQDLRYTNYDKAIIVSGDGDFHCLVEYLLKKRKLGRLIVPNKSGFSYLLRRFRDYVVYVRDFRYKVESREQTEIKKRGISLRTKP